MKNWLQKLRCKHSWKTLKTRTSSFCRDHITFSDLGMYDDHYVVCQKCNKDRIIIVKNKNHPEYIEWRSEWKCVK